MWGVNFFQLFCVSLLWSRRVVAKVAYGCAFSEDVKECSDFDNKCLNANELKLQGDEGLSLGGNLELKVPIEEGNDMCAEGWKMTEIGNEMVFSACGDICDNLNDTNTPWYPILRALNATICPIESKIYDVEDMTIDLGFASDVMCHEFVGEYLIKLMVVKSIDTISCHELTVSLFEYEVEDE